MGFSSLRGRDGGLDQGAFQEQGSWDFAPRSGASSPIFAGTGIGRGHARVWSAGGVRLAMGVDDTQQQQSLLQSPKIWAWSSARESSGEWAGGGVEEAVVEEMERSYKRRIEGLIRENRILRMRRVVEGDEGRDDNDDDTEEGEKYDDVEGEMKQFLDRGEKFFERDEYERKTRKHDLDCDLRGIKKTMKERLEQRRRFIVDLRLCRARLARALGLYEDLETHTDAASLTVKHIKDDALRARYSFWKGVSLYQNGLWELAEESFTASKTTTGRHLTKEEVEFALQASRNSVTDGKASIEVRLLGFKRPEPILPQDSKSVAMRKTKRFRENYEESFGVKSAEGQEKSHQRPGDASFEHQPLDVRREESPSASRPVSQSFEIDILSSARTPLTAPSMQSRSSLTSHQQHLSDSDTPPRPESPTGTRGGGWGLSASSMASASIGDSRQEWRGHQRARSLGDELEDIESGEDSDTE